MAPAPILSILCGIRRPEAQACADLFLSDVSGGALGGEAWPAWGGELFQRREKAGSSAHRHTRRDLCLLVLTKERVRICGAELHATRHQRRSGPRWLRWQDAGIRGGQNTHGERGCACFAGTERYQGKATRGGPNGAAILGGASCRRRPLSL